MEAQVELEGKRKGDDVNTVIMYKILKIFK